MKKTLLLFITFFAFASINAQTTRVLFIGNSFTYVYDVDQIFKQLAIEAGANVFVDRYATAGLALGIWTGNNGHNLITASLNKIAAGNWDYVVVQDNLGIWVGNNPYQEGYDDVVENLQNIKAASPCAQVIYFAGWCPVGGAGTGDSKEACGTRVYDNFVNINDNGGIDEIVSPVAKSWNTALSQYPGVNLYYSDNQHASIDGAYLAASTLFVSILKKDIRNLSYYPTNWWDGSSMNSSTANSFRNTAWDEVTSRMVETNLDEHTPTITTNGNMLTATGTGFTSPYQWYLNENPVNGATGSTLNATSTGTYYVTASNSSGCKFTSFEENLVVTGIENITAESFQLNKTGYNQYQMVSDIMGTVYVYNLQGKLIKNFQKMNTNVDINLNNNSKGLYFVTLVNDTEKITKKITIN